jgi:RNA-directed DNA polymerase
MKAKPLRDLFDAMQHGKFEFEDFLCDPVAANYEKIIVKGRTVYSPNKKLKAYHTFLNTFLCEHLTINSRVVYSYRKGANPSATAAVHAGSRAFFQTDLANFFGSIDAVMVRSTLIERGADVPISDFRSYMDRLLQLMTVENTLPIGFATSPLISNACLTAFDDDLECHCLNSRLIYTRYADDIVISAQSREALSGIQANIAELLTRHFAGKLQLNPDKSKLTSIGRKIKILGMVILPSGRVTIDGELKKRVEVLLHFYVSNRPKFLNIVRNDPSAGLDQLGGYVNYINSADKAYLEKLRKKFGSTVVDSFLHRSAT